MRKSTHPRIEMTPLHGLIALAVMALLIHLVRAPDFTRSFFGSPTLLHAPCAYEVFIGERTVGSVLSHKPLLPREIFLALDHAYPSAIALWEHPIPCGCAVSVCSGPENVTLAPMSGAHLLRIGQRIELNRAQPSDLVAVPGIGPVVANDIVRQREANGSFVSLDQLDSVPGVGRKTLASISRYLTVGPCLPCQQGSRRRDRPESP